MENVYSDKALATSCVKIKCIFSSVQKQVGIHVVQFGLNLSQDGCIQL